MNANIPTEEAHEQVERDGDLVVRQWRAQQLRRLGLSSRLAQSFAAVVDWHEVAKLVERGCTAELAVEIVR